MTARELKRIATRLANQAWVRYWLNWSHPVRSPWVMAIQCREADGRPVQVADLLRFGFEWDGENQHHYVNRTNDDGTPYGVDPRGEKL